ncbi:hypothetical protein [Streptomyces mirabilis]|uniref:hypothetical protein n=1 Tax=Streptomyces mirabilis TaxID=68239 RepID=UPI003333563E
MTRSFPTPEAPGQHAAPGKAERAAYAVLLHGPAARSGGADASRWLLLRDRTAKVLERDDLRRALAEHDFSAAFAPGAGPAARGGRDAGRGNAPARPSGLLPCLGGIFGGHDVHQRGTEPIDLTVEEVLCGAVIVHSVGELWHASATFTLESG